MRIIDTKSGSNYVVEFQNEKGQTLFRLETPDFSLAQRTLTESFWLYHTWKEVRPKQTGPASWSTFQLTADARGFPTRTGAHAVIFAEIERCQF